MHRFLFPLAALALTGCHGCRLASPAVVVDEKQLVGLTVREAIAKLGAKEVDCTIGDEPPGIARYVIVELGDGREVQLWLARHPGMMREDRNWAFELVSDKPVVRVEVK